MLNSLKLILERTVHTQKGSQALGAASGSSDCLRLQAPGSRCLAVGPFMTDDLEMPSFLHRKFPNRSSAVNNDVAKPLDLYFKTLLLR